MLRNTNKIVGAGLCTVAITLLGCSNTPGTSSMTKRTQVQWDRNGQPRHTSPANNWWQYQFVYHPKAQVYFEPYTQMYFWHENGQWEEGYELPPYITLDPTLAKVVRLNTSTPHFHHETAIATTTTEPFEAPFRGSTSPSDHRDIQFAWDNPSGSHDVEQPWNDSTFAAKRRFSSDSDGQWSATTSSSAWPTNSQAASTSNDPWSAWGTDGSPESSGSTSWNSSSAADADWSDTPSTASSTSNDWSGSEWADTSVSVGSSSAVTEVTDWNGSFEESATTESSFSTTGATSSDADLIDWNQSSNTSSDNWTDAPSASSTSSAGVNEAFEASASVSSEFDVAFDSSMTSNSSAVEEVTGSVSSRPMITQSPIPHSPSASVVTSSTGVTVDPVFDPTVKMRPITIIDVSAVPVGSTEYAGATSTSSAVEEVTIATTSEPITPVSSEPVSQPAAIVNASPSSAVTEVTDEVEADEAESIEVTTVDVDSVDVSDE